MSKKVTLGGDRLGSGKKLKVDLHGFSRSTHDLGRIWRSTMSAGTLVPFMVEYGLPGDVFNIDLGADVKTYPTLGPLFGSFKLQLDVFQAPIRLYNAMLHNNALGIGMNMSKVKLPEVEFKWLADNYQHANYVQPFQGKHINSSSIHAYLGIRGLGRSEGSDINNPISAKFNAVPYLAYWDIYKNYYANKQEEIGMVIHGEDAYIERLHYWFTDDTNFEVLGKDLPVDGGFIDASPEWNADKEIRAIEIQGSGLSIDNIMVCNNDIWLNLTDDSWNIVKTSYGIKIVPIGSMLGRYVENIKLDGVNNATGKLILNNFPLENIDNMRDNILKHHNASSMIINEESMAPYGLSLRQFENIKHDGTNNLHTIASYFSQEGLGIKTYQSDIFNNWLSTEWIDGTNGINEITSIDTSDGSFKIDTLNLANKVYDMLNRIAVSGGSYDDWINANWSHESFRRTETPVYHGGLSKEVVFQEVVSNSASDVAPEYEQRNYSPLGSLAGKGGLSNKNKGGKVQVKVHEPSVIIGIVSLTPRIDYSQGNEWHINLKTLDDFHKPGLDEIGFQELITEQMAEWDVLRKQDGTVERKSAGKQPAWINYMTSFNRTYGNFADPEKEMYMTLNRRYEYDEEGIKDLTTYIDPQKYNYLFAHNELSAQNFWVQIGADITARRKMSAKVMPNL